MGWSVSVPSWGESATLHASELAGPWTQHPSPLTPETGVTWASTEEVLEGTYSWDHLPAALPAAGEDVLHS